MGLSAPGGGGGGNRVSAGGLVPLPETGNGEFQLTDGNTNTYGTEVEIDAVAAEDFLIEYITVIATTDVAAMVIRLSVGEAASEVLRVELPFPGGSTNKEAVVPLPKPFKFALGERLTAAVRSGGNAADVNVQVGASRIANLEAEDG